MRYTCNVRMGNNLRILWGISYSARIMDGPIRMLKKQLDVIESPSNHLKLHIKSA